MTHSLVLTAFETKSEMIYTESWEPIRQQVADEGVEIHLARVEAYHRADAETQRKMGIGLLF